MEYKNICAIIGRSYEEIGNGRTEIFSTNADYILSIREKIRKLAENGVTDFICNAEYGFSLWAAEYIISLRDYRIEQGLSVFRLHIVRVYEGQPFKWEHDIQDRFFNMLDESDSEMTLFKHFREDCYEKSERFMIDCSNMLLTDDTGNFAAQYAGLHGKPFLICDEVLAGVGV